MGLVPRPSARTPTSKKIANPQNKSPVKISCWYVEYGIKETVDKLENSALYSSFNGTSCLNRRDELYM